MITVSGTCNPHRHGRVELGLESDEMVSPRNGLGGELTVDEIKPPNALSEGGSEASRGVEILKQLGDVCGGFQGDGLQEVAAAELGPVAAGEAADTSATYIPASLRCAAKLGNAGNNLGW